QIAIDAGFDRNDWLAIFIQRHRPILIQNFTNETWIIGNATVGDGGVGHRHLQRRGQHITLAYRNVGGVGLRPAFPRIMNRHPLRSRHDSWLLAREMNTTLLPQAERVTSLVNRVDSSRVSVLIEKRVARNLDRVGQSKRPMGAAFLCNPAMEIMVAVGDAAAAIET